MSSKIRKICWILFVVSFALYCVVAVNWGKNSFVTVGAAFICSLCLLHLFIEWMWGDYLFHYFGHVVAKIDTDMQIEINDMIREQEEMKRKLD